MAGIRTKTLVLAGDFQEIGDSTPLVRICEHLVQQGHHVLCTSTTKEKEILKAEKANVERMKSQAGAGGTIELIRPEDDGQTSSVYWIAGIMYRAYFRELLNNKISSRVRTIIATYPTTAQTGFELKEEYGKGDIELVLIATSSIQSMDDKNSKIEGILSEADAIWSLGPDIYTKNHHIFNTVRGGVLNEKHKELFLGQSVTLSKKSLHESNSHDIFRVSTIWQKGVMVRKRGTIEREHQSDIENYKSVALALGDIASARHYNKKSDPKWNIFNCPMPQQSMEKELKGIMKDPSQKTLKIDSDKQLPNNLQNLNRQCLKNSSVIIAPERNEETFNFEMWDAVLSGTPALVCNESSIGRILQDIKEDCPHAENALVSLTGIVEHDAKTWKEAIYDKIYNNYNDAMDAAKKIGEYLNQKEELWEPLRLFLTSIGSTSLAQEGKLVSR